MTTPDELKGDERDLLLAAAEAAQKAYSPYSGLLVGAAIVGVDGDRSLGCNVENASFGLTICAERVAIFNGVARGASRPASIAVWTSAGRLLSPCGACRQVLHEFSPELRVTYGYTDKGGVPRGRTRPLGELLPDGFVSFEADESEP